MKNIFRIILGCCAVFFCAASTFAKPKGNKLLSIQTPLWTDTCAHLKQWEAGEPADQEQYREQYDTLRLYIEHCAASDDQSFGAFTDISSAVQFMSSDSTRFENYRNWLISVLYLNTTNPEYFCVCIASIADTYQYGKYDPLGYLAVLKYLRDNHHECWGSGADDEYTKDSAYDAQQGYDPTHLPPLDSLGLGFLLKSGVNQTPSGSLPSQYLASFTSSPNPFTSETKMNFVLNRMTYVTIEVYDLLGNKVFGNAGRSYEAGSYEITLDGSTLPSGTLYARISTGFGEVKTVKLVHEK